MSSENTREERCTLTTMAEPILQWGREEEGGDREIGSKRMYTIGIDFGVRANDTYTAQVLSTAWSYTSKPLP